MLILARCPNCGAGLPFDATEMPAAIACGGCRRAIALAITEGVAGDRAVDACPVCRGANFYVRKDFNPQLGLAVVVVGALVSAAFYWFNRDLAAYAVLAGAALLDLIVYGRLGEVTVCYRCHTEFRGGYPRTAAAFDLHTADLLELEYERAIGRR
ncbi:MAG: hypothetical protein IT176_15040 [Acidobacteria bacterium]|nr:hypothetical protein [Acidobacteriota bacterium]